MEPKTDFPTIRLRYTGLFDFSELYALIVEWMKQRRFWFQEKSYKHKVPSPLGAEQELDFIGDKAVTEFYKQEISMNIHLYDMTEVEVVHEGVTKKLTNARVEISIQGNVVIDYEKRWQKGKFNNFIFDLYRKYIAKKEMEALYGDQLYYRMYKLHAEIKNFFDMQTKGNEYAGYLGDNL